VGFNRFEWVERLDTTVRRAMNPIRRERYAELQREITATKQNEMALAAWLNDAYTQLSQDPDNLTTACTSSHAGWTASAPSWVTTRWSRKLQRPSARSSARASRGCWKRR
jgi:hypothetical protein